MPSLSIIIPALGPTDLLESTLVSVLENRPRSCEILVVLGCEYDDPYQLKGEVQFISAEPGSGLVECLNLGIQASQAPIVHVLASGVEATEGWTDAALSHFTDRRIGAVAPLVVDWLDSRKTVAAGLAYAPGGARKVLKTPKSRTPSTMLGPTAMAGFYRKSALALAGGFESGAGDSMADVDLALRLRHLEFGAVLESKCRVQAASEHMPRESALRQALAAERVFWRNLMLVGWKSALAMHPIVVAGECARHIYRPSGLARLFGRFIGLCHFGSCVRHYRQMSARREAAQAASSAAQLFNMRIDRPHQSNRAGQTADTRVRQ